MHTSKRLIPGKRLLMAGLLTLGAYFPGVQAQVLDPIGPIPEGKIRIRLETVSTGLTAPNYGTHAPGLPNYLFVTDQPGILWAINVASATGEKSVFLDVSSLINGLQPNNGLGAREPLPFDERGLLGVAFHPDFESNRKLYTFTSEPIDGPADFPLPVPSDLTPFMALGLTYPNHQSVIREWLANDPGNPSQGVDPASTRVLLRIEQPQFNHNSGAINFGPDGMLYATIGDGGGADDQPEVDMQGFIGVPILGHGLTGNGQNPGNILGNIIRIDPDGNTSPNQQYSVPEDNPFFVGVDIHGTAGGEQGCVDGLCDEIFAYGFRNAFRFSFDMETGILFVADVGQNDVEEVDIGVSGGNYGWKLKEGTFLFDPNGANAGFPSKDSPNVPLGMIDPIAQYDHDEGVAIVGGFVFRGREFRQLEGRYVFGDFAQPPFNPAEPNCDARLFFLNNRIGQQQVARRVASNRLDGKMREFPGNVGRGLCLLGFGQDANGEVYVLGNGNGLPLGKAGVVKRITRARINRR